MKNTVVKKLMRSSTLYIMLLAAAAYIFFMLKTDTNKNDRFIIGVIGIMLIFINLISTVQIELYRELCVLLNENISILKKNKQED